jgi:hypothetical protein
MWPKTAHWVFEQARMDASLPPECKRIDDFRKNYHAHSPSRAPIFNFLQLIL